MVTVFRVGSVSKIPTTLDSVLFVWIDDYSSI